MAYNSTRMNSSDQIRLYVGDVSTSTANELLADTDYVQFSAATGNIWIAAQLAANSLAAKFAGIASDAEEKKVGDLVIKRSHAEGAAEGYQDLAKKFGRMAATAISPYAGGMTHSDKAVDEADTDRVPGFFARGLMDNPAVLAFTGRNSST